MPLTDTEIRRSKPSEKPYKLADSAGMFLLVSPAGGKLWRLKYRFEGTEKLMALGRYPEVTLAAARERRDAARKRLANGTDPMAQRKDDKRSSRIAKKSTFAAVAESWIAHWRADKAAGHVEAVERRMKADILPAIGRRPITEIEAHEIVALAKTIQDRGASDVAKRVLQTIGQIFRYAMAHGIARRNPATDFRPGDVLKPVRTANRARIDAKELPALLRDIESYRGRHLTKLAMKLMALTFTRTAELTEARWTEVDLEAKRWTIPAARMKMRTVHIVPLARPSLEVLELLKQLTGAGEFVFPGEWSRNKPMSRSTPIQCLEILGYQGRMSAHGFRGIASTILNESGFDEKHIEAQLGHLKRDKVAGAYNHAQYLAQRTEMMDWWGNFLEAALLTGKLPPFRKGGEV